MVKDLLVSCLLCLSAGFALAQECPNPQAVEKNNEAVGYIQRFQTDNPDSVQRAIDLLDEAIAIDPSYRLAYSNKIQFQMYLKDKEGALETFSQLERLGALDPVRLLYKGMLRELNGRKKEAMDVYAQVVSLFRKQLGEKPDVTVLMNYALAVYLKDGKKYAYDDLNKKMPEEMASGKNDVMRGFLDKVYGWKRDEVVEKLMYNED